jgi:choline-sulfatase
VDLPEKEQPNIVFIMTDDQAPWGLGAVNPNLRTPNLDLLCSQGVRFSNLFGVSAVCSPCRGSVMTSRYSSEIGIPDYIPQSDSETGLDPAVPTWPRILSDAGYRTSLIGKWHLGGSDMHHPTKYGYDEFIGFRHGAGISKDPVVEVDGVRMEMEGFTPDILTDFALDFVRRQGSEPFLLSLHYWAPHANTGNRTPDGDRTWLPLRDEDWNQFKDMDPVLPNPDYPSLDIPRLVRMTREYCASISSVDRNVGRLMKALSGKGITEETVVIFTSDNGYNMGHNGIWHKGNGRWILEDNRGDRPNLYDNSLRVPAIVRWPGEIPGERIIRQTATHLDWFPTLVEMTGSPWDGDAIRGRSLLPLLQGRKVDWDNDLFAQYSMWDWNQTGAKLRAFRSGGWKLVRDFAETVDSELYHLGGDPAETTNMIDSGDPVARKMRGSLERSMLSKMDGLGDIPCND